jgi:predicted transcriptional regulator
MDGFADVILEAETKGVTRSRLAYLAGVDTRTISHWAEGRSEPKLAILRRLLVKGDPEVKGAILAYLTRGTGWHAAPVDGAAEDRVMASAQLMKEAGDVAMAVASGAGQERLEAEVAEVVTAAARVTGAKARTGMRMSIGR